MEQKKAKIMSLTYRNWIKLAFSQTRDLPTTLSIQYPVTESTQKKA